MRIDKILSNLKYGTRNEIKKLIKKKNLLINGTLITDPGYKVNTNNDEIEFLGEKVYFKEKVTLMMNKPKGYVSANKDNLHKTVFELIDEPYNRFDLNIAGRLDIDTEGLLLLTTDGEYLHSIITPHKDVYKKYYVEVDRDFDCTKLLKEMKIKDGKNNNYQPLPPLVEQLTPNTFYLSIKEGKFHQVKRMCLHYGREVTYLKRVSIGDIVLDANLNTGEYKEL